MSRRRQIGFTLIELMIVVAIVAILAVVAGTAYRKYMDSARTTEAYAMLGEIRNKEEAYRAEFSSYLGWGGGSEATTKSLPQVDGTCSVGHEPCAKDIPTTFTGSWAYWQKLGISAGRSQLQCGYIVNTNNDGSAGTIGSALLGTSPATPWWYAIAICDNDGNSSTNATFATASTTTAVSVQNEHK